MKTYKNIVVATDFSGASLVAYHYAHRLASRWGASLKVVHAFQVYVNMARPDLIEYTPSLSELQEMNEKRISDFVNETTHAPNSDVLVASRVKVTTEVKMGFAPDYLIELSNDPSVDLLVLGTSGEKTWFDRLLGSVSVEVAQNAHCPVLLVPKNADFRGIHNILYAVSEDSAKPKTLHVAVDMAKYFMASLHFVHVNTASHDEMKEPTRHFFNHYMKQYTPEMPYGVYSIKAPSVMTGIWDYGAENYVDLVVIVSHQRDFWERFNHHSVSKDLSLHTQLPILYLYSDAKHHLPT